MNREEMNLQIEKIRKQYAEKDEAEKGFDALRELDKEVKRPAKVFAYTFGTAGALIMGTGMSLAMDAFGPKKRVPGVLIGTIGLAMMCANYPMYQKMLDERKKEYAQEILDLTDNMIFEEE
ncbi:MAG: dihydropteridine reductase [Agathobacter sp.]|nr:dihydropteridine reductase [Agathobacter sp.]